VALSQNTAWRFREYNEYEYRTVVHAEPGVVAPPPTVADLLEAADREPGRRAFLLVTHSQTAAADLYGTVSAAALTALVDEAVQRGVAHEVHSSSDAALYELRAPA